AVVEIEMLEVLELGTRSGEELLDTQYVVVHRAAHVEEEEHLHRVVQLRHHAQVEPAGVPRGRADGAIEIEDIGRALAREAPEPPKRHLDIADAQLAIRVVVAELALVPHLHGATMPRTFLA